MQSLSVLLLFLMVIAPLLFGFSKAYEFSEGSESQQPKDKIKLVLLFVPAAIFLLLMAGFFLFSGTA